MLHGGVADEAGGAGDQDFLERHAAIIAQTETVYALPGRPEEDLGEKPLPDHLRGRACRAPACGLRQSYKVLEDLLIDNVTLSLRFRCVV
jgi:hypothetical protein